MAKAPLAASQLTRKRLFRDRCARWLVTAGGAGIVASILGILFFIVWEVWPLVSPVHVTLATQVVLPGDRIQAMQETLNAKQTALQAQFAALEATLSQNQSTASWLASQINSLPGYSSK